MNKNFLLNKAKSEKNDEFYTQYCDIEKELNHYKDKFVGKVVYCNCDDYTKSNFTKYFKDNFSELKLKKLISTGLNAKYYEYDGENEVVKELGCNGDFRSDVCTSILEQSDVVVSNPPFSLFRDYVTQLMKFSKKFLIIGNMNAITYKEIFPYIKDNELWLGCTSFNTGMYFCVSDDYKYNDTYKYKKILNGTRVMRVPSICWFTNINHSKRNKPLKLSKVYNEIDYPKYDNYNAIEVSKVADIPMDFDGVMGTPVTFLDKYCPEQFEIIGGENYTKDNNGKNWNAKIDGKSFYKRILIRKKNKTNKYEE